MSTTNFARVTMGILLAGREMYDTCGFTVSVAEQFVLVSAENTQSETSLWFVTNVQDGPAIYIRDSNVSTEITSIPIPDSTGLLPLVSLSASATTLMSILSGNGSAAVSMSVSPSYVADATVVPQIKIYNSSVILNVTVYVDSRTMSLVTGSYIDFIRQQNIVSKLQARNITKLEWTGFGKEPTPLDTNIIQSSSNETQPVSVTAGAVSSIVILGTMATGLGAYIIVEATLNSAVAISGALAI